ncbi:MAG: GLUG motif-containing protein, partial [Acetobacteraceae bacterium]
VGRFELASGNWVQNTAPLPSFAATDFRLTGGSFLRAAGGAGTGADPYRLTDIYGVQGMGSSPAWRAASYRLANNIAAAGTSGWNGGAGFVPVGTNAAPFTGSLDGAGYVINGLTINRQTMNDVGLIGVAGSGSSISNLGLVGGSVRGQDSVGGLVGVNFGTITQAYATGAVTGRNFVGGLVGANLGGITQAYATGAVTGTGGNVGGLVGGNSPGSSIMQAYATGAVEGSDNVGGLVGFNDGSITEAYATTGAVTGTGGNVGGLVGGNLLGTVENSFWFKPADGSRNSLDNGVGTGLDEAAMRDPASFTGWDLSSTWNLQNAPRPFLRYWQQSLTATVANVTTTYTGNNFAGTPGISYSVSGFVPETAPVFDYNGGGAPRNAGTYTINACCLLSTQQYAATVVPGTLTINAAPLTITGGTTTSTYTANAQTNTSALTVAGLLGSDSVTGVNGRASGTNVGTYSDALSGATGTGLGNYTISYVNGGLIINAAPLTITGGTTTATYTAAAQTNSFTTSGLLGSDSVTGVSGRATGTNV